MGPQTVDDIIASTPPTLKPIEPRAGQVFGQFAGGSGVSQNQNPFEDASSILNSCQNIPDVANAIASGKLPGYYIILNYICGGARKKSGGATIVPTKIGQQNWEVINRYIAAEGGGEYTAQIGYIPASSSVADVQNRLRILKNLPEHLQGSNFKFYVEPEKKMEAETSTSKARAEEMVALSQAKVAVASADVEVAEKMKQLEQIKAPAPQAASSAPPWEAILGVIGTVAAAIVSRPAPPPPPPAADSSTLITTLLTAQQAADQRRQEEETRREERRERERREELARERELEEKRETRERERLDRLEKERREEKREQEAREERREKERREEAVREREREEKREQTMREMLAKADEKQNQLLMQIITDKQKPKDRTLEQQFIEMTLLDLKNGKNSPDEVIRKYNESRREITEEIMAMMPQQSRTDDDGFDPDKPMASIFKLLYTGVKNHAPQILQLVQTVLANPRVAAGFTPEQRQALTEALPELPEPQPLQLSTEMRRPAQNVIPMIPAAPVVTANPPLHAGHAPAMLPPAGPSQNLAVPVMPNPPQDDQKPLSLEEDTAHSMQRTLDFALLDIEAQRERPGWMDHAISDWPAAVKKEFCSKELGYEMIDVIRRHLKNDKAFDQFVDAAKKFPSGDFIFASQCVQLAAELKELEKEKLNG